MKLRDIATDDKSKPVFPEKYDVAARDKYYNSISYSGWGGASGHDVCRKRESKKGERSERREERSERG